ncbi:hypothetical protein ACX27_19215 [Nostoc piscinale CENA21]|uniref:Uncharacterized protein n=1 Tax=Nostoc piscinale CENA21 TaxID=224013 RepID=A0A0M4ST87_9NOSO|nr:hypothetical protein [Nostoc piscinale]ALF54490.1 hypothetical protein ACX27_19215 [Nostoc piscinale CENA21]
MGESKQNSRIFGVTQNLRSHYIQILLIHDCEILNAESTLLHLSESNFEKKLYANAIAQTIIHDANHFDTCE